MSELTHGVFDTRPETKVDISPPNELQSLRNERDQLMEALECARYALTHRESDQTFALCAIDAALTPAGEGE